jgi:hypothetical protein
MIGVCSILKVVVKKRPGKVAHIYKKCGLHAAHVWIYLVSMPKTQVPRVLISLAALQLLWLLYMHNKAYAFEFASRRMDRRVCPYIQHCTLSVHVADYSQTVLEKILGLPPSDHCFTCKSS